MQNQALLDIKHPTTIILQLTTKLIDNAKPLRLRIKAQAQLKQDSDILIDQIRSIDNRQLNQGPLVICTSAFMEEVYQALHEIIGVIK